jgi:hypothetical protein
MACRRILLVVVCRLGVSRDGEEEEEGEGGEEEEEDKDEDEDETREGEGEGVKEDGLVASRLRLVPGMVKGDAFVLSLEGGKRKQCGCE